MGKLGEGIADVVGHGSSFGLFGGHRLSAGHSSMPGVVAGHWSR